MKYNNLSNVRLIPGLFKVRQTVNRNYLMSLSSQALLQSFYIEAGIIMPGLSVLENPAECGLHWGWEAPICQLRGHFLGHWMSAASMLVETENDLELRGKLEYIVSELARCQERNRNGWIGSIPEKYFDILETDEYIWSPQYTLHKTLMGLLDAYKHAGIGQALDILKKASDWYINWISRIPADKPWVVLKGESGGMLEIWASLYEITKEDKYMDLCKAYSGYSVFEQLLKGEDALTDKHANASIPTAHGAAKMYEITGDKKWLSIAELFWKCAVTDRPMYATGSANAGEFYIAPGKLYQALGDRNQEFCTMYNTVRLADYLYRFTRKAEYLDYIEIALYNGFLAQQNKRTGMPTYFLPMKPGSRKKWGTPRNDFWCCHGTMVQAQAYYPYLCYYTKDNEVTVAQYIPSQASFNLNGNSIKITQNVYMTYGGDFLFSEGKNEGKNRWQFEFRIESDREFALKLRIPKWHQGEVYISVNGEKIASDINDGFICIKRKWSVSDRLELKFNAKLTLETLPDRSDKAAVMEGPIVLAGIDERDEGLRLVDGKISKTFVPFIEHTYDAFPWQQSTYRTVGQGREITFMPLYEITDEPYNIYYTIK
ncbi:hypothetical protein DFR55_1449 [Herbinix hemicellulosilytica]|uniref:DUF1680 family protein n=1 Tax=Herbinix hemicellulosilytica TaxID=1564487 RepID=A0A0H5SF07_HERHM|nr:beta-L-arabinofuranosidase domain-containing protein [Herbinix hemicellulosilytica]RBP56467.1 hypothetical protein DFR55_1449 [Herbinix hemicellulosilytica]CRZ34047.1 hypothetical protein HHT355_0844 [Herbinix hemicellulosilytica]